MSYRLYRVVGALFVGIWVLVSGAPTEVTAQTDDFACNAEFTVETTQLATVAACPVSATEQSDLRTRALEALQATAELECRTSQDDEGNSCPTATPLGCESRIAANCSEIIINLGSLGVTQAQITFSLTMSGRFQCTP